MVKPLPFVLDGVEFNPRPLPIVPEISLYLMQDDYPQHGLDQASYRRLMLAPPYWAFCWGGGQAIARWLIDNQPEVAGKTVVDFGAGSGVAAIAGLKAGAKKAYVIDIDLDALKACHKNAELNRVEFEEASSLLAHAEDLLLAADICYEELGFGEVIRHIKQGGPALVAESRLRNLGQRFPQLRKVAQYKVRTFPDLEESENHDLVQIFATDFGQKLV